MHTYKHSKNEAVWTVGYFEPIVEWATENFGAASAKWIALKDFNTEDGAAAYASYLNGGSKS